MLNRLKTFCQATDIYTSQRLVLIIIYIMGFCPFQITRNKPNKKLTQIVIGYAFTAFHIIFFTTSVVLTLTHHKSLMEYYTTLVSRVAYNILIYNKIAATYILYGSCMYGQKKIENCIKFLASIDRKLQSLGIEINHHKGFMLNLYCAICLVVINFTDAITIFVLLVRAKPDDMPAWPLWTSYFQPPLTISVIVVFYTCISFEIKQRLAGINQILHTILSQSQSHITKPITVGHSVINKSLQKIESVSSLNSQDEASVNLTKEIKSLSSFNSQNSQESATELLQDTITIHNDLCDLCSDFEEYFGLKMLIIAGIAFIITVFNAHFFIRTAIESDRNSTRIFVFLSFGIFMNLLGILCIAQSSHSIANENENCPIYVHKIMNKTSNIYVKEKLVEFSLQLIHRKIKLSALDLIPLNRKLLVMIVATTAEYLLILLQFAAK